MHKEEGQVEQRSENGASYVVESMAQQRPEEILMVTKMNEDNIVLFLKIFE